MFWTLFHLTSFFNNLIIHVIHIFSHISVLILLNKLFQFQNILLIELNLLLHIAQITWDSFNLTLSSSIIGLCLCSLFLNLNLHLSYFSLIHIWYFSILVFYNCYCLMLNTVLILKLPLNFLSVHHIGLLSFVFDVRWFLLSNQNFFPHRNIGGMQRF